MASLNSGGRDGIQAGTVLCGAPLHLKRNSGKWIEIAVPDGLVARGQKFDIPVAYIPRDAVSATEPTREQCRPVNGTFIQRYIQKPQR